VLDAKLALSLAAPLGKRSRTAVAYRRGHRLRLPVNPASPDPGDLPAVRRWVRAASRPTAIDLFCGAGGLSLGLTDAGFSVLVGADFDAPAIETYAANLAGLTYLGDLADPSDFIAHLEAWGVESVDLIAGGVPCQPFSRAGRSRIRELVEAQARPAEDSRTSLWRSFVEIVRRVRPRAVLLENVPDLAEWEDGAILVGFCESLRELGYQTDARILSAFEHGVPQHRTRLFIVGLRDGTMLDWPRPEPSGPPTLWDAIGDLPEVPGGQREERLSYASPISDLQRRLRRDVPDADRKWIFDHITRDVRADDLKAYELLKEGGTYEDLPAELQRYRSDIFTDKYKRLVRGELSRTITAHMSKDGYWYIHPLQHRTLSMREAARVQTFPDWFRFAGEPTHRYRQIGNAVPPLLAESLGEVLRDALAARGRRRRRQTAGFREDLLEWHSDNSRTYPWRQGASPWRVLLAEMCLHRTRADQVGAVYPRLLELGPSPTALLDRADEVRELLGSLGLRWRVDNILRVAEALVRSGTEEVPDTREGLLALPGVGDYVANAVLCFGFGRPAILMDTNTERIVDRVTGHAGSSRRWQMRLDLYRLAGSAGADQEFNYALLDLGALVCRASTPRCLVCPVSRYCATFASERESPEAAT
jgi:DNA (cytosine-5)-methyltransferase 1